MQTDTLENEPGQRSSGLKIFLIVVVTIFVTAALTFWVVRSYIFPAEFKPVQLSASEEQVLTDKLERLDMMQSRRTSGNGNCWQKTPTWLKKWPLIYQKT